MDRESRKKRIERRISRIRKTANITALDNKLETGVNKI